MLRYIPLLILPLGIYAVLAILSGGHMADELAGQVFTLGLASGAQWRMSLGDSLVGLAIICEAAEVVRSARATNRAIAENMASVLVWIAGFIAFLMVPGFGTSAFALMLLLLLSDFLTDSVVMVLTAKRTVGGIVR